MIELGRVLVGTPGPPSRGRGYLPEDAGYFVPTDTLQMLSLPSLWCYQRNVMNVERLVSGQGERSLEIAALSEVRVLSRFRSVLRRVPPKVAAFRLLDDVPFGDPSLAVTAAEAVGDAAFVTEMRKRVAREFHDRAKKALSDDPDAAVLNARSGLEVFETEALVRLLADAERRAALAATADARSAE